MQHYMYVYCVLSTVVLNFSRILSFDKEAAIVSSFDKEAELMVQHNDDKLLITHIFTNLFNIQHAVHT